MDETTTPKPAIAILWGLVAVAGVLVPFWLPLAMCAYDVRWSPYFLGIYPLQLVVMAAILVVLGIGIVRSRSRMTLTPVFLVAVLMIPAFFVGCSARHRMMVRCMAVFYHMNGGGPNGLQADIAREIATLTPENDGAVGVSFNTPRRGLEPSKSAPRYMGPWIARFEPNSAFIGSNFGNEPIFVMDYGGGFMDPIGYRIGSPAFRPGPRFVRYPGERGAPSVIWPEHEIAPGVYVYGIP